MSLQPIAKSYTGIAKRVYDEIMAQPTDEAAALYAAMVVSAGVQYDLTTHSRMIQHRVDKIISKRVDTLKEAVLSSYVSKRLGGENIEHLQAVAEVISKAGFDHLSDSERRSFAERQSRDPSGRFRTMHAKVTYTNRRDAYPDRHAAKLGIKPPPPEVKLSQEDKAAYQQAYAQVNETLKPFTGLSADETFLQLTYANRHGGRETVITDKPMTTDGRVIDPAQFRDGGRLVDVGVVVNPNLSVQGAAFDVVGALGGVTAGSMAARGLEQNSNGRYKGADRLGSFDADWNQYLQDDAYNPSNRVFRRMSSGSRLLTDLAGDAAPMKLQLALRTGDFIGQYGAEAQKVIGPAAEKASYRYRGVEKKPAPQLQQSIDSAIRTHPNRDAARNFLIYGSTQEHVGRGGRVFTEPQPSPLISYFKGKLADPELLELQLKSGTVPPSQGIIINKKGQVVTEAVGYGDDWYLPFNLKTLSQVRGGEYIRTRAYGGLTTEDVYAGLVSGARAVTVVSHNGVYTMEFDDSFRGSRRYNDKASRMVKRYGHILDAVKSKQVTLTDVPPERLEELKTEAARTHPPRLDRKKYEDKLEELKELERKDPVMPKALKNALAEEFLYSTAPTLATEQHQDWTELAGRQADLAVSQARAEWATMEPNIRDAMPFDEKAAREIAMANLNSPEKVIAAMGPSTQEQYKRYAAKVEADYRAKQSPLLLDGAGYEKAMYALKEQFPYYVASVNWQEEKRGGIDQGYVKPRFNRPEKALAGYYDKTIEGTGKISADQTNNQNRRVMQGRLRPIESFEERQERKRSAAAQPSTAEAPSNDPEAKAIRQAEAYKALGQAIRDQKQMQIAGKKWDIGPVQQAELKVVAPAVFHEGGWDGLVAEVGVVEAQKRYDRDFDKIVSENFFPDLNLGEKRVELRDPDKAARGRTFRLADAMLSPNQKFDFPDYPSGQEPAFYEAAGREVLERLDISADFGAADLEATLTQLIQDGAKEFKNVGRPGGINVEEGERVKQRVEDAHRVKALRRLHTQAVADEAAKAARDQARDDLARPQVGFAGEEIKNSLVDEVVEEMLRRQREEQNKGRIIGGEIET